MSLAKEKHGSIAEEYTLTNGMKTSLWIVKDYQEDDGAYDHK